MSDKTRHGGGGGETDPRLTELLRADAAGMEDDDLDIDVADETPDPGPRAAIGRIKSPERSRSQVYSIRVPVERLEQVRQLARQRGVAPTVMLRDWVLAQLDAEVSEPSEPPGGSTPSRSRRLPQSDRDASHQDTPVRDLEAAIAALISVVEPLTGILAALAEPATVSSRVADLIAGCPTALPGPWLPMAHVERRGGPWYLSAKGSTVPIATRRRGPAEPDVRHLHRGLAQLRSTIQHASSWPGVGDVDMGTLYVNADEELSSP